MAMWFVPREDPGLKAVERLKRGLNELTNMPKSTNDIENFKSMRQNATKFNPQRKADKVRTMLTEQHTFLKSLKQDLARPLAQTYA